jgi:hypothetical protein
VAQVKRSSPTSLKSLAEHLKELDGLETRIGWFPTAKYPDGTPVAFVAAVQEFGVASKNIPARPFLRPTREKYIPEWRALAAQGAKAMLAGKQTAWSVMEAIGLRGAADVAKTISEVFTPPLSPKTIAARLRKRSDRKTVGLLTKPLVDSGLMISTVTSQVRKSGGS